MRRALNRSLVVPGISCHAVSSAWSAEPSRPWAWAMFSNRKRTYPPLSGTDTRKPLGASSHHGRSLTSASSLNRSSLDFPCSK